MSDPTDVNNPSVSWNRGYIYGWDKAIDKILKMIDEIQKEVNCEHIELLKLKIRGQLRA